MPVNRERQVVRVQGASLDAYCATTPEELIQQIKEYVEAFGSTTTFEYATCDDSDSDSRYLYAYYERPETNAAMAYRIKREEDNEKWLADRAAQDYARLKAKFEGTK